jgi:metal-responsive CopG/Arc/MetJ family transcriptional regulator
MNRPTPRSSNCQAVCPAAVINLFLSGDILAQLDRVAKNEGRTRCELVREAIRRYITSRMRQTVPRWGAVGGSGSGD